MTSRSPLGPVCLSALAAVLSLSGGCARERDIRTMLLVQPETARALGYSIAWTQDLGLEGRERIIYAELLGDKLVTFESGNIVSVRDAATGKRLWGTKVGSDLERFSAPRRAGDRLILCSESRAHIYDIQVGGIIRILDLAYVSNTTPIIHKDKMIHGSPSGVIFRQDLNAGIYDPPFSIGEAAASDPILCGNRIVITSTAGRVFAFEADTLLPIWGDQTWGPISAQHDCNDDLVFVPSEDRSLYAFARVPGRPGRQGREVWRYYTDSRLKRRPHVVGDNVYQYVPSEGLVAIDAATGKAKWTLPWDDAKPIMLKGGRLYVLRPGRIVTVTPDDGLVLDTIRIPAVHDVLPESESGGALYLIRLNGRIMKLVPLP